ncbi:hypothetical protein JHK85_007386 [Glycine max]|nr:hypothetical protein JHK85_007386 [Glycine max]KAG5071963.1 hypothetical protein JHK86_007174 [Glycine max]
MARVPNKIKLIDGSRETLKLFVRIPDLWFIGIPEKSEQAKMVIVDSDADLKENLTYVMHNFKVMKNDGKFRICDHEYKLSFTRVIVVRQSNMEHLPFRKFKFVDFSTVIAGHFQTGLLVVVFRYVSSKNMRVVFKLKDLRLCFLSYLNEVEDERSIINLLTHARIKKGQGSYPLSISNSFKASKLMINKLVLEIQEFRERLLDLWIEVRSVLTPIGQGSSQVSGSSQLSSKDAFLSKAEAKNISQINVISKVIKSNAGFFKQEIVCVTVAKITTIVMDNHSWCYLACGQCHKKIDIETVPFTCPFEVMVNHKGEHTKFLLWDHECAELIGQSADEVNRLKIEDGNADLNVSPQALDRLLGCFLAFKVKVQPRFRNVVVLKYSDESDLINVVLDMLLNTEVVFFQQSVFVTADHDPLLRIPLIPTKCVSSDELDDEPKNFEISHVKVSSNKIAKHCQA